MGYAILSDIHGNFPALAAVLQETQAEDVQGYFVLGDYYNDFPYPNEVAETLRQLPNANIVAGNKEEVLAYWHALPKDQWVKDQFGAVYWNLEQLTNENLEYLLELPLEYSATVEGFSINISHKSQDFFGTPEEYPQGPLNEQSCSLYSTLYQRGTFPREGYGEYLKEQWENHPSYPLWLERTPPGVYLFGHSHVQWHTVLEGRLLVNSGSVGHPLDLDPRAAYTLLTLSPKGWTVEPRRVAYDQQKVLSDIISSGMYDSAPVWMELVGQGYAHAKPQLRKFFSLAEDIAKAQGESTQHGFSNAVWQKAGALWRRKCPSVYPQNH